MFLVSMADIIGSYERLPNDAVRAVAVAKRREYSPILSNNCSNYINHIYIYMYIYIYIIMYIKYEIDPMYLQNQVKRSKRTARRDYGQSWQICKTQGIIMKHLPSMNYYGIPPLATHLLWWFMMDIVWYSNSIENTGNYKKSQVSGTYLWWI